MLDIKFIRENAQAVQAAASAKHIDVDVSELLTLDARRLRLLQEIEQLQADKNAMNKEIVSTKDKTGILAQAKQVKNQLEKLEQEMRGLMRRYEELTAKIPTIPSSDTPVGKSDADNVEVKHWGNPTKFDFEPKDHIALGTALDVLDFERGVKVSGFRGYYIKNEGVSLVLAFLWYALHKMIAKGYTPMIPPTIVKSFALFGSGYFKGLDYDPGVDEIYALGSTDATSGDDRTKERKFLVGTAEPSLLAYYADETLDASQLPMRVCGFSQCYRSEIGSYSKDLKGIYRVHEFMKVEQIVIAPADVAQTDALQQEMLEISEEIYRDLGLPYRIVQICTGDMSAGKYKAFDIEAWMPSHSAYREVGSASNFLDWQSRRLNVRYKDAEGKKQHVYMLNNTAIASVRPLIAILENYQNADGSVTIPEALRPYMGGKEKIVWK